MSHQANTVLIEAHEDCTKDFCPNSRNQIGFDLTCPVARCSNCQEPVSDGIDTNGFRFWCDITQEYATLCFPCSRNYD